MSSDKAVLKGRPGYHAFPVFVSAALLAGLLGYGSAGNNSDTAAAASDSSVKTSSSPIELVSSNPGNIFYDNGSDGSVSVNLTNPDKIVSGALSVTDEKGNVLENIDIKARSGFLKIALPSKGYYRIKASARYMDGSKAENGVTAAVIGKQLAENERLASFFGLWHLNGDIRMSGAAGSGWTRRMWGLKDYKVDGAGKPLPLDFAKPPIDKGYNLIGTLAWPLPAWLTGVEAKKELYPPEDWGRFAELVERFARDVPDFPPYFEVFNEPEVHWKGTEAELVRFIGAIARGIRAVHPGTKVLGPTLYRIDVPKLERLVDLGLLGSLDGLSIHAYVYGTKPEAEFFDRVRELKTYLSSIGKAEFPVYITEFGWTTAKGTWQEPIDELTQAKYLSRAFLLLATEDIKAAVYFCQLYRNAPNPGEEAFSILHQDHTPKPAFAAFANASRWLAGISQERRLVQNGDLNLALFLKGQTAAVAAWDTGGGSFLSFESEPLAAEDMTGRPVPAEPRTFKLDDSPVFISFVDPNLFDMAVTNLLAVNRGEVKPVPFTGEWADRFFNVAKGTLTVMNSAPRGRHTIIGMTSEGWRAIPFDVQ